MLRISYKIEDFEGPLDLLLTLISKNKMNIADVEIITIINQYLRVINSTDEKDLDTASEFIDMAARLIYLKSVYLLPKDNEGEILKAQLQGQLIEYSQAKAAAAMMRNRFIGDDFYLREREKLNESNIYDIVHPVKRLTDAYSHLSDRSLSRTAPQPQQFEPIVNAPVVSVSVKIYSVLKGIIKKNIQTVYGAFAGVKNKSEAVATFLAILELVRAHRVVIGQDGNLQLIRKENR